ncbi:hypothetical protein [Micromonospora echinofusca]|uniref:Uncharacterized protein n=1 Tax=Micromonospora echinofusca TaxID=47858 RepID=A0ABS3VSV8_MICEH|nr:hypothetical protein [Micromonospora echinofusca]MBO4207566.1 hypothetical protein [Micromonospora echinofusca]
MPVPDPLLTPTITATPPVGVPPWRPQSLLVPAVLGGVLAVTVLGLVNAGRLDQSRSARLALLGTGLLALGARIAVTLLLTPSVGGPARAVGAAAGVLTWLTVRGTQSRPFRAYELRGGEPARLFWPGLAAIVGFGVVEAVLLAVLLAWAGR